MRMDSQCDLAALVFDEHENPDEVLLGFCNGLKQDGFRPIGLVQHVDGSPCTSQPGASSGTRPGLSVLLIHADEHIPLFQDLGSCASGCRLDIHQLLTAGSRVATAIDHGADLVVINRFGHLEREGKGLAYLIELAMSANIPTVIAVPSHRFADWIKFSDGMSVKLRCDTAALEHWWQTIRPLPSSRQSYALLG